MVSKCSVAAAFKTERRKRISESFNYYWPQDLDDEFLIVWYNYPGAVKFTSTASTARH